MIPIKTQSDIDAIRESGRIVGVVLNHLAEKIRPGVTTLELDKWAEATIRDLGGEPAFKGYHGFPATLCTSINEQVVHGIPSNRSLQNGDLVSIDVGAKLKGWYSDAARTYAVGDVDERSIRLIEVTKESLDIGVAQARVGNRLSDIGHAIQQHVEKAGFSVVRDFVGHGVGRQLHEEPQIPNFGEPHQGVRLKKGMVLAIEPMVNSGTFEVKILEDQWTVVTKDKERSAHFEYTIAVSDGEAEVLTK